VATEAGISRASGYRLDRRVRASAAAPTPPVPTVEELAAAEAERDQHRKAKSAERSRRARAKKAEHAAPKPERKRRAIPWSETREEFIARRHDERSEELENPRRYLFRWSQIKTNDMICNYDHQDFDDCTRLATSLIERGDEAPPRWP
jgi:FtsZ-interacting cell division protein YlmF